jgi:hypothetical protein
MSKAQQIDSTHYKTKLYETKQRFCSYWHQIDEIFKCDPSSMLEIGIGSGFLHKYLKSRELRVTTCDINPLLYPDVIASVLFLPFNAKAFDLVACFEVLEHLDYGLFPDALSELSRVSAKSVLISLPDVETCERILVDNGKTINFAKYKISSRQCMKNHIFDGEHYWEIGKQSYPLQRIVKDIECANFEIIRTYRVFENPYHRFFILQKKNNLSGFPLSNISGARLCDCEVWRERLNEIPLSIQILKRIFRKREK